MFKYAVLFVAITIYEQSFSRALIHLEGIRGGSKTIQVVPLNGCIELKEDTELDPIAESPEKVTYSIAISYPVNYVRLKRLGQLVFLPVSDGEQTYRFLNDTSNIYETTNEYQQGFFLLQAVTDSYIIPFRDSLYRFDQALLPQLPQLLDTLNLLIRNHPFENELKYTFIKIFHYQLSKKLLSRKEVEKLNRDCLKELDHSGTLFSCWGYNKYVSTLLDDHYTYSVNMFNYPFKTYKSTTLGKFVLNKPLFFNQELNNFLGFYKIQHFESSNEKILLFSLADSLSVLSTDPYLKSEIDAYRQASTTRIQPLMKAPDFMLKKVGTDTPVRLNDIETVVVLDFWATWCGPCVKSLPKFGKLHRVYQDSVRFIIISQDNDEKKVVEFLQKKPDYTWTFLFDGQDGPTGIAYEAKAIPKYVIINEAGVIVLETIDISEVEVWLRGRFK